MSTILVSLLVPCYNAARYLPSLADSLRTQALPFAEIICYDDGSTDDTVSVARSLGLKILLGEKNRGVSHARNRLASAAACEWIHFQDADDPLLPDFLSDMEPLLRPEVDVAVCDTHWIDAKTRAPVLSWLYPAAPLREDALAANLRQGIGCNTMIVRRELFLSIGGFDETLRRWEDADLHVRLAAKGGRYDALERVAAISLRHSDSLSHDYRAGWQARLTALVRYAEELPPRVRPIIAEQAERAAEELLALSDSTSARTAVSLARSLGRRVPSTQNPLLRLACTPLSPLLGLRLQRILRRLASYLY